MTDPVGLPGDCRFGTVSAVVQHAPAMPPTVVEETAMPRRPRTGTGQLVFHVMNRAVQGVTLFERSDDYRHFLRVLAEATRLHDVRLLAFEVMPTHWHLVVWPGADGGLAAFMKQLTATHAQEWRRRLGSTGRGAVYQGRYKAIGVQHDGHLLRVIRYVERNALRARLVEAAEDWPWGSASAKPYPNGPVLTPWPVRRPDDWLGVLNAPEPPEALENIRKAVRHARHFGTPSWRARISEQLAWRQGWRGRGRRRVDLPPPPRQDASAESG
jgi:putative transposase